MMTLDDTIKSDDTIKNEEIGYGEAYSSQWGCDISARGQRH